MKVCITGNPSKGLAKALVEVFPNAMFLSRETGHDLTQNHVRVKVAELIAKSDVFINNSALSKFNQTVLLDAVYQIAKQINPHLHIINIGSTTDRVKAGRAWLYNAEKKALRDYSNSLSLIGVWDNGPKVTYISFGTMSNNQEKHPDRKVLDMDVVVKYIKWVVDQPREININEISIDPMQNEYWYGKP